MKRIRDIIIVTVIITLITYGQAVFSPRTPSNLFHKKELHPATEKKESSFVQGKLPATDFANFLNQSSNELVSMYGEPLEIQRVSEKQEWWAFGESSVDYFEALIVEGKVESIFVLGKEIMCDGFRIGMNVEDISELTTLYSNFSFKFEKDTYIVELSEKDMNYQPLIAFENGQFAMLHINRSTGSVIGIRYVTPKTLLATMPYQLQKGKTHLKGKKLVDTSAKNEEQQIRQLLSLINTIRENESLATLVMKEEDNKLASTLLDKFIKNEERYIEKERVNDYLKEAEELIYERSFYLDSHENELLLEKKQSTMRIDSLLLYTPTHDIPLMLMNWYGELLETIHLDDKEVKDIGIAFKEDKVMVLLKKIEKKRTEDSRGESSDLYGRNISN